MSLYALIELQVKKFMVGYEMLAQSQRDLTSEQVRTLLVTVHIEWS